MAKKRNPSADVTLKKFRMMFIHISKKIRSHSAKGSEDGKTYYECNTEKETYDNALQAAIIILYFR